ncbi:MAG: PIN domain-containing protein [Betaproteobacteria bacterium]|nr:PIN domain-containing protein [Betaproteobacteria bacterium]
MSLVFVDTNVLVYGEDAAFPKKQAQALEWLEWLWRSHRGRLSVQVLNEFYVTVTRKLAPAMPMGHARAEIRRYQSWQPLALEQPLLEAAWAAEAHYGLSFWDSLIVASAQQLNCRYLLSEDLQHEQTFGKLQVINPFHTSPNQLEAKA